MSPYIMLLYLIFPRTGEVMLIETLEYQTEQSCAMHMMTIKKINSVIVARCLQRQAG